MRFLFTPSDDGDENLAREGISPAKICRVGNVMIDSLVALLPRAQECFPKVVTSPYALVTLHRPSNVDDLPWLGDLLRTLSDLSTKLDIVFPCSPRTRQRLQDLVSLPVAISLRFRFLEPLPYLEFIALQSRAAMVITDSGGIQEEATFLGVPCLTVRNTERPITVTLGTNQLVGRDLGKLRAAAGKIAASPISPRLLDMERVPLWDGKASDRIAQILVGASGI